MAFDRKNTASVPSSFGWGGENIDLSSVDFYVTDRVKAVVVCEAGDIVCRPVNADEDITLVGWAAGALLPWHCSVIRSAGTTAKLATVEG